MNMAEMRVRFKSSPKNFFASVKNSYGVTWAQIAKRLGVSVRTISSWRLNQSAMPLEVFESWQADFELVPPEYEVTNMNLARSAAGRKGGLVRQRLYGNFGTNEGRVRGGVESIKTHGSKTDSPFVPKKVARPKRNKALAELVGCILGDGTISYYQVVLYSNLADEREYAIYLGSLFESVFDIRLSCSEEVSRSLIKLICSRRAVVVHLNELGLNAGNKVKKQTDVPEWIKNKNSFSLSCLRGLIDTDGCAYLDTHKVNRISYKSPCIAFTNASAPLLDFVEQVFRNNGYQPARWGRHIRLRRKNDVERYMREVGFGNPKHLRRIRV